MFVVILSLFTSGLPDGATRLGASVSSMRRIDNDAANKSS